MREQPLVSVVMPAYNAENYIGEAIESVQAQTYQNWELHIVDDCSSDTTPEIARKYAETDSRITVWSSEKNSGVSAARNRAIEKSRGAYIALLDSDDVWLPEKLEAQMKLAEDSGADIVYCSYAIIGEHGQKIHGDFAVPETADYHSMLTESVISCSTALIKAPVLKDHPFGEGYYHEDYILWLELLKSGAVARGVTEVLACYRILPGSRSNNKLQSAINRWAVYRKALKMGVGESAGYFMSYAWNGMKKYGKRNPCDGTAPPARIQVLVAAMNQTDYSLPEKMNIRTDAIVGNQCDRNEITEFRWNDHNIIYYSLAERGVGLNRETILNRAGGDIVLFADEDVKYVDNYPEIVGRAYAEHPEADLIIFDMIESRGGEQRHTVSRNHYAGRHGVSRFGMVCVSARLYSLRKKGISFHLIFGGGAEYSCGEDTIFLQDCIKKGLRVYTCTETIGTVFQETSTWFHGYNDKYFFDKGVLLATVYPRLAPFLAVYHALKHRSTYREYGVWKAVRQMYAGIRHIR